MTNGVKDANEKKRKLNMEDVYEDFKKYNFIIHTNMGTIDTSKFNLIRKNNITIFGESSQPEYELFRITPNAEKLNNSKPDIQLDNEDNTTFTIEDHIILLDNKEKTENTKKVKRLNTINSIQIKSIRNDNGFLLNQLKPIIKP